MNIPVRDYSDEPWETILSFILEGIFDNVEDKKPPSSLVLANIQTIRDKVLPSHPSKRVNAILQCLQDILLGRRSINGSKIDLRAVEGNSQEKLANLSKLIIDNVVLDKDTLGLLSAPKKNDDRDLVVRPTSRLKSTLEVSPSEEVIDVKSFEAVSGGLDAFFKKHRRKYSSQEGKPVITYEEALKALLNGAFSSNNDHALGSQKLKSNYAELMKVYAAEGTKPDAPTQQMIQTLYDLVRGEEIRGYGKLKYVLDENLYESEEALEKATIGKIIAEITRSPVLQKAFVFDEPKPLIRVPVYNLERLSEGQRSCLYLVYYGDVTEFDKAVRKDPSLLFDFEPQKLITICFASDGASPPGKVRMFEYFAQRNYIKTEEAIYIAAALNAPDIVDGLLKRTDYSKDSDKLKSAQVVAAVRNPEILATMLSQGCLPYDEAINRACSVCNLEAIGIYLGSCMYFQPKVLVDVLKAIVGSGQSEIMVGVAENIKKQLYKGDIKQDYIEGLKVELGKEIEKAAGNTEKLNPVAAAKLGMEVREPNPKLQGFLRQIKATMEDFEKYALVDNGGHTGPGRVKPGAALFDPGRLLAGTQRGLLEGDRGSNP